MRLSWEENDDLGDDGGAASSSLVRLLDREPGQANRRLIQRRRVYVYMSA